jgi:hypothetical protein
MAAATCSCWSVRQSSRHASRPSSPPSGSPRRPLPNRNRKTARSRPPICRTITTKITGCSIWQMATAVPGRQTPSHNRRTGASGYPHSAQCQGKHHGGYRREPRRPAAIASASTVSYNPDTAHSPQARRKEAPAVSVPPPRWPGPLLVTTRCNHRRHLPAPNLADSVGIHLGCLRFRHRSGPTDAFVVVWVVRPSRSSPNISAGSPSRCCRDCSSNTASTAARSTSTHTRVPRPR